ncbi:hypothetical protein LEMLEM_LOCUS6829 [Lemmus lemmus]
MAMRPRLGRPCRKMWDQARQCLKRSCL